MVRKQEDAKPAISMSRRKKLYKLEVEDICKALCIYIFFFIYFHWPQILFKQFTNVGETHILGFLSVFTLQAWGTLSKLIKCTCFCAPHFLIKYYIILYFLEACFLVFFFLNIIYSSAIQTEYFMLSKIIFIESTYSY